MSVFYKESAGDFAGNEVVTSPGAWTDVTLANWDSLTARPIPTAGVRLVSLEITETSGAAPAYLLLRANNGEAVGVAWQIPTSSSIAFNLRISAPPIQTIAVYGTARLKAYFEAV